MQGASLSGASLLLREGRLLQLTDVGKVVFARAQVVLAEVARLRREAAEVDGLQRGELTIGMPPAGRYFLPVIRAYRKRYPGIALRLREQGGRAVEEGVLAGELDLGVTMLPAIMPGLASMSVTCQPLTVIFPLDQAPKDDSAVALRDLAGFPFVMHDEDFVLYRTILDACANAGFQPVIAGESRQWDFIGELVATGLGIAILPEPMARQLDPGRVACRLLAVPELRWEIGLVWRADYLSGAAKAWIDCCKDTFDSRRMHR